ncbi:unnamed protein product, partial [Didymodactylos carnosus]
MKQLDDLLAQPVQQLFDVMVPAAHVLEMPSTREQHIDSGAHAQSAQSRGPGALKQPPIPSPDADGQMKITTATTPTRTSPANESDAASQPADFVLAGTDAVPKLPPIPYWMVAGKGMRQQQRKSVQQPSAQQLPRSFLPTQQRP